MKSYVVGQAAPSDPGHRQIHARERRTQTKLVTHLRAADRYCLGPFQNKYALDRDNSLRLHPLA